jgi:hypothetical protein
LVGSDEVVFAFNELMQHFYSQDDSPDTSEQNMKLMLSLLGNFLLQIRRSMGNESTKLDHWQMLEWFMTDVRKWRNA